MMLADLESIQKRLEKNNKKNVEEDQLKILEIALDCINTVSYTHLTLPTSHNV